MNARPIGAWLLPLPLLAAFGCSAEVDDPPGPSSTYEVAFSPPRDRAFRIGEGAHVFVQLIQHRSEHCEESLTGDVRCAGPSSGPVSDFEIASARCGDAACDVLAQFGALGWMWEIRYVPRAEAGSLSVVAKEPSRGTEISGVFGFDAEP